MTKDDRQAFEVPDRLFEYVRSVVDNRALATVLLFLLSLLLIGIDNIAGILAVLLVGFLLIDRFEIVRRCMVIGGAAWAMTLAIGAMALGGIEGPVLFDAGFVFNMLGFVLALAACVLFLCGRALYYQGYEQGEQHADVYKRQPFRGALFVYGYTMPCGQLNRKYTNNCSVYSHLPAMLLLNKSERRGTRWSCLMIGWFCLRATRAGSTCL